MVRKVVIDVETNYDWVHEEVDMASIYEDKEVFETFSGNQALLSDSRYAEEVVARAVRSGERVYYCAAEGSRPFTYFYAHLFSELGVRLPLTEFQMQVLSLLRVAPTQLHPNAWAFVRGFEIICRFIGFEPTPGKFLYFFASTAGKRSQTRRWYSLSCQRSHFLKPYTQSFKGFKDKYFRVMDIPRPGYATILTDALGRDLFPLYWVPNPVFLKLRSKEHLTPLEQFEVEVLGQLSLETKKLFRYECDLVGMRNFIEEMGLTPAQINQIRQERKRRVQEALSAPPPVVPPLVPVKSGRKKSAEPTGGQTSQIPCATVKKPESAALGSAEPSPVQSHVIFIDEVQEGPGGSSNTGEQATEIEAARADEILLTEGPVVEGPHGSKKRARSDDPEEAELLWRSSRSGQHVPSLLNSNTEIGKIIDEHLTFPSDVEDVAARNDAELLTFIQQMSLGTAFVARQLRLRAARSDEETKLSVKDLQQALNTALEENATLVTKLCSIRESCELAEKEKTDALNTVSELRSCYKESQQSYDDLAVELDFQRKRATSVEGDFQKALEMNVAELAAMKEKMTQLEKERDAERSTQENSAKLFDQWKKELLETDARLRNDLKSAEDKIEDLLYEAVEQHDKGFAKALRQVSFLHKDLDLSKVAVEADVRDGEWIAREGLEEIEGSEVDVNMGTTPAAPAE